MTRTCCVAGMEAAAIPIFSAAFKAAGASTLATVAHLDVVELGKLEPDIVVCDLDYVNADPLELLRQLRFVLPSSLIAVYTGRMTQLWGRSCHLAGANCLLAKGSDERRLAAGLRAGIASGCYTDPLFAAEFRGRQAPSG